MQVSAAARGFLAYAQNSALYSVELRVVARNLFMTAMTAADATNDRRGQGYRPEKKKAR